jgi:hypothetical protein
MCVSERWGRGARNATTPATEGVGFDDASKLPRTALGHELLRPSGRPLHDQKEGLMATTSRIQLDLTERQAQAVSQALVARLS